MYLLCSRSCWVFALVLWDRLGLILGVQISVSASLGASFPCFILSLIFFSSLPPSPPAFMLSSSFPPSLSCVKSELKKCQAGAGQRNFFSLSSTSFHCLSPLLTHVSQSALERDAFLQTADTKGLGMSLPCSCSLPLPAKGVSTADFVSARQMIWNVWSLPYGGGVGAGEAKGATPEADAFSQRALFEPVVSTPRRLCYLNFPWEVLNTTHSTGMIDWREPK